MLTSDQPDAGVLKVLHRISRGYAIGGLTVPVFGIAVAAGLGVLGDAWLIVSMVLTAAAAAVLAFVVLPAQGRLLAAADASRQVPGRVAAAGEGAVDDDRDLRVAVGRRRGPDGRSPRLDDGGLTMTSLKVLKIAAAVEAVTVCLLFANLFTVHWPAVSSALGPTHGTAYLVTIVTTVSTTGATTRAKVLSFAPAIGGYLALRDLSVGGR